MNDKIFDVVIVGGGIMGSSTAYHVMKADNKLKVVVVEPDPTYERSSTTLSMAGVRIQFSLKENVQISQYALKILEQFDEEMAVGGNSPNVTYRTEGYLFMVDENGQSGAQEAITMQKNLGCSVEWWSPEKIRQKFPLYKTNGMVGGSYGPQDGHIDPYAFLMGYKTKAKSLGAEYVTDKVVELETQEGSVAGVKLASGEKLTAKIVINCAGAWAAEIAQTAGITLPVEPTNRQIFTLDTAVKPETPLPLTILPSGLYFRTEAGGVILLGKSLAEDTVGFDFSWDDKRFMEILWPELAEFVPAFESLKLVRGWGGLYAVNTLDENAILGEWPELKGFFLANGFSGHGLQQAPAVGRYLSELITEKEITLDLSIFSPERILENKPISEGGWEIV